MSDQILDHVGIKVSDFERSKAFYRETLATLGIEMLSDLTFGNDRAAGFGREGEAPFWISSSRPMCAEVHVAFTARSRAEVSAFYAVALSMGGRDNGAPGLRAQYHPHYYGVFVLDPDGNNIEAVCHRPEDAS